MKNYEITEENVSAAFEAAKSDETKEVLAALFGEKESKPDLDDYKSIKTYEDACEALGEQPVSFHESIPKHIAALVKLETISKALWGKDFQPKPDAEGSTWYYYPWFALYTKKEIEGMTEKDKGAFLSASAVNGALAGFGNPGAAYRSSTAGPTFGFRLCQETEEKALYFGKQFAEIWGDYLAFNFTVGERIK